MTVHCSDVGTGGLVSHCPLLPIFGKSRQILAPPILSSSGITVWWLLFNDESEPAHADDIFTSLALIRAFFIPLCKFSAFSLNFKKFFSITRKTEDENSSENKIPLFPCFEILTKTLQCPSFPALHVVLGLQDRLNCVQCIDSSFFSALNLLQAIFLNCSFLNWQWHCAVFCRNSIYPLGKTF